MPRLFTGLEIPEAVAARLSLAGGGLSGAKWIAPSDYHVTLRFIGEVDGAQAREIDAELRRLSAPPFALRIGRLALFGRARPHALVALVEPAPALVALQADHEMLMRRLGLAPEPRKFTPHVTLARLKGVSAASAATYLEGGAAFPAMEICVRRTALYSARMSRGGGPYLVEATYPLDGPG